MQQHVACRTNLIDTAAEGEVNEFMINDPAYGLNKYEFSEMKAIIPNRFENSGFPNPE